MIKNIFLRFNDLGYPFDLTCPSCEYHYEGCYNNNPCIKCGETKNIKWRLKDSFKNHKDFKGTKAQQCTIENMKIEIKCNINIS